jgi:hypothetical protein
VSTTYFITGMVNSAPARLRQEPGEVTYPVRDASLFTPDRLKKAYTVTELLKQKARTPPHNSIRNATAVARMLHDTQ